MGKFKLPFSNNQLLKIGSFGAVFVIGNAVLMHYLVRKRFKDSSYYVLAQETVMKNKALVEYLGEPLKFGAPDLSDSSKNYSTSKEATFEIPLKGSKTEGTLYLQAIRLLEMNENLKIENSQQQSFSPPPSDSSQWLLKSVQVSVKGRPHEKLILVRDDDKKT